MAKVAARYGKQSVVLKGAVMQTSKEPWAGSKDRQKFLVKHILDMCELDEESPIDVAGAVGTIVANTICDISHSREDALDGFKMWCMDMVSVIDSRFPAIEGK